MQGTPRGDPDREHWPERSAADEPTRSRLRALFDPVDAEDPITELIAEHGRELDARAEELRRGVVELEGREARARELQARVEHVLREGSAELDARHSELDLRALELDEREGAIALAESRLEEEESRVAERARAFGAVELRSAAVERRERALHEREEKLALLEEALRDHDRGLDAKDLRPPPLPPDPVPAPETPDDTHLAFALEEGYRLFEREGAAPAPGETVELASGPHRCVRVTASPYPADSRRCAVLEPVPRTAASLA
jgi:hypothetical protein